MPYQNCHLCPHACSVNRAEGQIGRCSMTAHLRVARVSLHLWEEPPISGKNGSGTVFFSGCPLSCVYCQNRVISHGGKGEYYTENQLVSAFFSLKDQSAHNINLVTATHFLPTVISALKTAKSQGLDLPIVYNTSGYETVDSLRLLEGLVDIYLTDLRYMRSDTAQAYSSAPDYPEVAKSAIAEMVRQAGKPIFDSEGIMQKGVIVRLLLLPSHLIEAKMALRYLWRTYHSDIYFSLMSQYTPISGMQPPLDRPVTEAEYRSFLSEAVSLGITQAFTQDHASANTAFIPSF